MGVEREETVTRYLIVVAALTWSVATTASAACQVSDITIKSIKTRIEDPCSRSACPHLAGVGVLVNRCGEAVGVQVQVTGLDAKGEPVSTNELWPASVRNIPPGEYTFSLNHYLKPDRRIKTIQVRPIDVRRWR